MPVELGVLEVLDAPEAVAEWLVSPLALPEAEPEAEDTGVVDSAEDEVTVSLVVTVMELAVDAASLVAADDSVTDLASEEERFPCRLSSLTCAGSAGVQSALSCASASSAHAACTHRATAACAHTHAASRLEQADSEPTQVRTQELVKLVAETARGATSARRVRRMNEVESIFDFFSVGGFSFRCGCLVDLGRAGCGYRGRKQRTTGSTSKRRGGYLTV